MPWLTMRYALARGKYIPWRYEAFLYFLVERVLMIAGVPAIQNA
jgi:hypothetical protein